jgi:serine protease inhibitor
MRHLTAFLILLIATAALLAEEPAPSPTAKANNAFATDLYGVLRTKEGNLFFSPYSITTALAMTRAGARGETATGMDEVLHFGDGIPAAEHARLAAALQPGTVTEGWGEDATKHLAHEMRVANTIWAQDGLKMEAPFLATLKNGFKAPLERIDFTQTAKARKIINDWVAVKTEDRIRDIIPEDLPTADTLIALANAIWFKAAWKDPFNERFTAEAPFTTASGKQVPIPLMHRNGTFGYTETDDLKALEIPYRGEETSMVILLPRKPDGLPAVESALSADSLAGLIGAMKEQQVDAKIPKFEITAPIDLTGILPKMGMTAAFNADRADFTGMTTAKPLFIGAVLHKAFIKVDEAGTEAAAATVVMMMKGGVPHVQATFTADHPFLFLIRHRKTGLILFLGRFAGSGGSQ